MTSKDFKMWKLTSIIILLSILINSIKAQTACERVNEPNGISSGDYCYIISSASATFRNAGDECVNKGGQLATIKSSSLNKNILNLMQSQGVSTAWTGLRRYWMWEKDKSLLNHQGCYTDVATDRDLTNLLDFSEFGRTIKPDNCQKKCQEKDSKYYYAAVQTIDTQISTNNPTGTGCFCGSMFGSYGTSAGCDEPCVKGDNAVRCGGPNSNDVYRISGSFSAWAWGQPNNYNVQSCGSLDPYHAGKMQDEKCNFPYRFVCGANLNDIPSNGCSGYTVLSASQTCVRFEENTKLDYDAARRNCTDMGSGWDLLFVKDDAMFNTLSTTFTEINKRDIAKGIPTNQRKMWAGFTKNNWAWPDGTLATSTFANWQQNNPNRGSSDECMQINYPSSNGGTWKTSPCGQSNQARYFCQLEAGKSLNSACTSSDRCADSNAECRNDGSFQKCLCKAGYYNNNGRCSSKVPLNSACSTSSACADRFAQCSSGTCQCVITHYNNAGQCALKKALGSTCGSGAECADANTQCSGNTCVCRSNFYNDNGICRLKKALGTSCSQSVECADNNAQCISSICTCTSNYYNNAGQCAQRKALNDACTATLECLNTNAECRSGQCLCVTGYVNNGGQCTLVTTTTERVITGTIGPNTGASTGGSNELTIFQKVLIFCLVLLAVAIIVALILFIYYKKKHNAAKVVPNKYATGHENGGLPPPQVEANGLAMTDGKAFANGHTNGNLSKWKDSRIMIE